MLVALVYALGDARAAPPAPKPKAGKDPKDARESKDSKEPKDAKKARDVKPSLTATSTRALPRVTVFPVEPGKGIASARAYQASRTMLGALGDLTSVEVIRALGLGKDLGIDLRKEARNCREGLTCLVQLGRAIGAERLLLGSLKKQKGAGGQILRFSVIDVKAARYSDSVIWAVPNEREATRAAVRAAVRQLFTTPDARLTLQIEPVDARVFLYGELVGFPPYRTAQEVPFWAGTYHGRIERPGYLPKEIRVVVPVGATRLAVKLERDPLFVELPPERAIRAVEAVEASRLEAEEEEPVSPASPWANLFGWSGVAVGVGITTLGGIVMGGAQADYNSVSGEIRYTRDRTRTAFEAIAVRDSANLDRSLGVLVVGAGLAITAASIVYMALEAAAEEE